jgi:hypothetical protein
VKTSETVLAGLKFHAGWVSGMSGLVKARNAKGQKAVREEKQCRCWVMKRVQILLRVASP